MSIAVHIVLTVLALGALWLGWEQIGILRGTWFHDVRLILLLVYAVLVLSLAQWIAGLIDKATGNAER